MCTRPFGAVAAVLMLSGCAIHPLPEDVTGVDTYHIVRQIRCETRNAVIEMVRLELTSLANGAPGVPPHPRAQKLLADYDRDPELISTFKPGLFSDYPQIQNYFSIIYAAGIAYSFDLTMTEDNNLGTTVNLLGPWAQKLTLGITGNANRQRINQRTFTVTDTLGVLLATLNTPVRGQRYCDGQIVQANYIYPIAGRIGVDKVVRTFLELNVFANLQQSSGPTAGNPASAPSLADKLTFTTTIDVSTTPKVTFSPIGKAFQLADASVTGLARRTDVHKVVVGVALPTSVSAAVLSLQGYLFSARRNATNPKTSGPSDGRVIALTTVTGQPRNEAERNALYAVDQVRSREFQLVTTP